MSTGHSWAQEELPYKPAVTFKGDTALYLEYNYTKRSRQYTHTKTTVGEVLQDLEYPVLFVVECDYTLALHYNTDEPPPSKFVRITLGIRQMGEKPSPVTDYYIGIRFEYPPLAKDFREATGYNRDNLYKYSQKIYDFIKDLEVASIGTNFFLYKDPEIIESARIGSKRSPEEQKRRSEEAKRERIEAKKNKIVEVKLSLHFSTVFSNLY